MTRHQCCIGAANTTALPLLYMFYIYISYKEAWSVPKLPNVIHITYVTEHNCTTLALDMHQAREKPSTAAGVPLPTLQAPCLTTAVTTACTFAEVLPLCSWPPERSLHRGSCHTCPAHSCMSAHTHNSPPQAHTLQCVRHHRVG